MKVEREFSTTDFKVVVIIQSLTVRGHSFMSDRSAEMNDKAGNMTQLGSELLQIQLGTVPDKHELKTVPT
jgi:hypothetical protein